MSLGSNREFKILTREEEVAAWEAGDFDALVESVWPFVLKTARSLVREDDMLYDEMISIAQLQIARSLKSFDPSHNIRFISYTCRFIRDKMLHARAKHRKRPVCELTYDMADSLQLPPDINEDAIEVADVLAVAKLICSEAETEALVRWYKGETFVDIARDLGCTKQNVWHRQRNAISKCKRYLAAC